MFLLLHASLLRFLFWSHKTLILHSSSSSYTRTMADNQSQKKKKKKSYIKDGVVLKVSDIEKECDRLRRRPRAALYPLLPITEPLKMKRKSIHLKKGRRRHRKHCRKRGSQVGLQRRRLPIPRVLNSRTRLVTTTTSGSEVSSLACSRNLNALHNQKSSLSKPHWASAELYAGEEDAWLDVPRAPIVAPEHPRHHHYHKGKHKHRICHHDPLVCGHRTSMTTSLQDLRRLSHIRHHRRCGDLEAGGADDKDSTGSNSRARKIVSYIIMSVASFILLMCVALVAVTLRLTPAIDELGKSYIFFSPLVIFLYFIE